MTATERYIYIACPWAPLGGGMFKVAEYLIQSQAALAGDAARLRPLDTRGSGSAVGSLWNLLIAMAKVAAGRLQGGLAGVHVNLASRMSLFRKGVLIIFCAALGVPTVLHLHAQLGTFYARLPALLQALTRWVFALPKCVIVIGPAAKDFVTGVLRVPEAKVSMVINGVPEPASTSSLAFPDGRKRLLFLGNLSDAKGVSDLLLALAHPSLQISGLEVRIAGGGDLVRYQDFARQLNLQAVVRFEGWCDQRKVSALLADCDVLVLPSHDEVLPLAILEGLAHGVAVVTTPVGEIPSLLTHGSTAVFVKPGDPESIAAGLDDVLRQPERRQLLGQNGRSLYQERFCLEKFFGNVADVHKRHFGVASRMG